MSEEDPDDFEAITTEYIREKIIRVLTMYPRLSRSMLQVGLSTALPPKMWGPIFDRLVAEGKIKIETFSIVTESGREMVYHVISLVPKQDA